MWRDLSDFNIVFVKMPDEKGRPLPFLTTIAINIGACKQFPNRTVLVTPSDTLSQDVKESLDKVCDKSKGGCWPGKSKK